MTNSPLIQEPWMQNGYHSPLVEPPTSQPKNETEGTNAPVSEPVASPPLADEWSAVTGEMLDTLPRVWTRGLFYVLIAIAGIVMPWAALSQVDETGSARGRLEPQGKTIRVDAPVVGTVTAIRVREGQTVRAGQTLLELESEVVRADLQQAQARLEGHLNRIAQLQLMQNELEIAIRSQRLQNQAQQTAQQAQIAQTRQRLNAAQESYGLARDRLARDQIELKRYQTLFQQGVVAEIKVAEMQRPVDDSSRLVQQSQSEIRQATYAIEEQQSNYDNITRTGDLAVLETERRVQEIQDQVVQIKTEINQTQRQIQALQFQLQQRQVRSPTDGIIFSLALEHAGAVLQPGQAIAQIAPQGMPLTFRAQMPSNESGFVRVGMPVKLKFDAYPFQDYGVVAGKLRWISPDSKVVETPQGRLETYELEVVLDQLHIETPQKKVFLTPGQTAVAEVVVRQRRVIDFILDPFKKLQKGGLEM
jgi:HlyD family secretion protein